MQASRADTTLENRCQYRGSIPVSRTDTSIEGRYQNGWLTQVLRAENSTEGRHKYQGPKPVSRADSGACEIRADTPAPRPVCACMTIYDSLVTFAHLYHSKPCSSHSCSSQASQGTLFCGKIKQVLLCGQALFGTRHQYPFML